METIRNLLTLLEDYSGVITAASLMIGGFWGLIKFLEQVRDKRFKTYHKLLDWLVNEQAYSDGKIKLDRQIAVVYELRNFPSYFGVSKRILRGLQEQWKGGDKRILNEIELTISYMERGWITRLFKK